MKINKNENKVNEIDVNNNNKST